MRNLFRRRAATVVVSSSLDACADDHNTACVSLHRESSRGGVAAPALRRLVVVLLFGPVTISPTAAAAMPATAGQANAFGRSSVALTPRLSFADPTTPCVLQFSVATPFVVSPLSKPAQLRAACATEAARGNLDARVVYGQMQLFGFAASAEAGRGLATLQAAALEGSLPARRVLGMLYRDGSRVPQDAVLARRWLTLAADAGDGLAADALGLMVYQGVGAPADPVQAYALFAQAAGYGDPHGAANAGRLMLNGQGVARDVPGSVAWFMQGAARGDADSEFMLGVALLHTYDLGAGVDADFGAALYWFRRASGQGDVSAQTSLAWHLFTGLGGEHDDREAFQWALRAAPNSSSAKQMVGQAYLSGRGVTSDVTAARSWLEKAAADGSDRASSDLAMMYETGAGVPRDDTEALSWHRKAAAMGSDASAIALALRAQAAHQDTHNDAPGSTAASAFNARDTRWLMLDDKTHGADPGGAPAADIGATAWDALSMLSEALRGNALMQYAIGVRYLTGDGVMIDRALGDAWLVRAQASFVAQPGFALYANATRSIEAGVSAHLTADERERAGRLSAHLLATVPGNFVASGSVAMAIASDPALAQ